MSSEFYPEQHHSNALFEAVMDSLVSKDISTDICISQVEVENVGGISVLQHTDIGKIAFSVY